VTYTLHFLPEVENDVIDGYFWYEEKAKGLGEEFLRLFYANSSEITINPLIYREVYRDFRNYANEERRTRNESEDIF